MIPAPESAETDQGVRITLSFLSPITPTSTLRQSVPASYLSVHVQGKFDVDIYVDVNGQWVSGDRGAKITWDIREQAYENGKGLKTMRFRRETEQILTEFSDRSEWGTLHLSAPSVRTSLLPPVCGSLPTAGRQASDRCLELGASTICPARFTEQRCRLQLPRHHGRGTNLRLFQVLLS